MLPTNAGSASRGLGSERPKASSDDSEKATSKAGDEFGGAVGTGAATLERSPSCVAASWSCWKSGRAGVRERLVASAASPERSKGVGVGEGGSVWAGLAKAVSNNQSSTAPGGNRSSSRSTRGTNRRPAGAGNARAMLDRLRRTGDIVGSSGFGQRWENEKPLRIVLYSTGRTTTVRPAARRRRLRASGWGLGRKRPWR